MIRFLLALSLLLPVIAQAQAIEESAQTVALDPAFEPAQAPALAALWRDGGGALHWRLFDSKGRDISASAKPPTQTPLGSLWKLFIFAWLAENQPTVPDYVCAAAEDNISQVLRREESAYCCPPGGSIGLEAALVRSCGPFFAPEHLRERLRQPSREHLRERVSEQNGKLPNLHNNSEIQLNQANWRNFWQGRPQAPAWLLDLEMMRPETLVSPESIIQALDAIPPRAREQAATVLLARIFDSGGPAATSDVANRTINGAATGTPSGTAHDLTSGIARHLGGQLRVKTFSWHVPGDSNKKYGGGAGWLLDGRPVWFAGFASGPEMIARHGQELAQAFTPMPEQGPTPALRPASTSNSDQAAQEANILAPGCVEVRLFARYPLISVEKAGGGKAVDGPLQGHFVAVFAKRSAALPFYSAGEINLNTENGKPHLTARLGVDEYVARVLDREADARETEAARALAVVARSYLLSEAVRRGNCLIIDDSSRWQRISPNPPSMAARAAAAFTNGLTLDGPVQYHLNKVGENRLAWSEAVALSRAGRPWDEILTKFYPKLDIHAMDDPVGIPCQVIPEAEAWLAQAASRWQALLYAELPGFEPPESPQICRLAYGTPFSEQDRGRIHLREFKSAEDRVTLAHEYLHLALSHHPAGQDEALIERWARRLTLEMQ